MADKLFSADDAPPFEAIQRKFCLKNTAMVAASSIDAFHGGILERPRFCTPGTFLPIAPPFSAWLDRGGNGRIQVAVPIGPYLLALTRKHACSVSEHPYVTLVVPLCLLP